MSSEKNRWGVVVFLGSMALVLLAVYVQHWCPFRNSVVFTHKVVPIAGLFFSVAAFFVGHFSYPRVHNLKVYLLGYVTGLVGTAYFALYQSPWLSPFPAASPFFSSALVLITMGNLLLILSIPSFVKYRSARGITLLIVCAEMILILVARFGDGALDWVGHVMYADMSDVTFWIAPFWFIAILCFTIWLIRTEFYLGGLISGTALLVGTIWIWGGGSQLSEQTLFGLTPLYLMVGILVHWFSRMEHRIAYDPLLHIYNRDYCGKIISEQSNLNVSPPFGIAMVDIDHFKNVNDTHGHQAGDAVLYTIAQAVCRGVVPKGIACRYGGEELAVFFPQKTSKEVSAIMEQVRTDIEKIKTPSGRKQITVTVSCGVSSREIPSQTITDVIQAADKALYKAKKNGRNQVRTGKTSVAQAK